MQNLILYNYFRSSTSYRVRIALALKGVTYEYKPVHLLNNGGEQNAESYRNLNPLGGVPTLVDADQTISQSLAIIEYLDEKHPQINPLFPKNIFLKAKVRQFCELINADLHPLQNLKVMQFLDKQFGLTAEQKQLWLNKWIHSGLTAAEKTIESFAGKYCFGDTITAADLFLIPQVFSAKRFNIDTSNYKILEKINSNCESLDAFKKAHPYRQIDTPADLKID